tara:strand:- start:1 stop:201 length:201 start_codon:yes stop_codon:yes gene_type:complete
VKPQPNTALEWLIGFKTIKPTQNISGGYTNNIFLRVARQGTPITRYLDNLNTWCLAQFCFNDVTGF